MLEDIYLTEKTRKKLYCVGKGECEMSEDDIKEISTGIVLLKEDDKGNRKILLIERFERGTFEIPKGHVEDYDKTVKMAAERELREVSLFVFSRNPRNKIR